MENGSVIQRFEKNLGPVERAQVVASTAVIVSMATIITAMIATGQSPRLMDFISILTVGLFGFMNVYFSLSYSRQLDEQRRELLAINTIADAVNKVVDLDYVLRTALDKATQLLSIRFGWIYVMDGDTPFLRCSKGTEADFLAFRSNAGRIDPLWVHQPHVQHERLQESRGVLGPELKKLGIQSLASIPLKSQDMVSGALILGGEEYGMITPKELELLGAFANQISVAMTNALLFERLRQSEQRYADLFENSPDIYFSVNRDGTVARCNKIGADLLGYPKTEIIGEPFARFFVSDRREGFLTRLMSMFSEHREMKDIEEQMVKKTGQKIEVSLSSSLVFDEKGIPVNARIVARDISERKMMEAAILHAQKIDSIGNLAGGIAHDFNNILASILGSASIMRRRLSEKARHGKYVEIIEAAARRGSSLTRQLLTFARKTKTVVEPVNINALISETLHLFQRSVSKGIVVQTNLSLDGTDVNGDAGQVQQGILNLMINARDAMPNGGTLTISTRATFADAHTTSQFSSVNPGPFVVITVSDTGIGMDKATQGRVFEPFFTTKDLGTGLGLSVLYGVVQNHGGFITLESSVGAGTTFCVYLPRLLARTATVSRQRRKRLPRGTESILMIDDEVSVCEIARDMLSDLGYSVSIVHDGRTGVEMYRERQASIDLVLLDVNMPVMGGTETFHTLKAINPNLPIIILTGYGRNVIEVSTFAGDVHAFLQKPFQIEELAMKVRDVLDAHKTHIRLSD